MVSADYLRAPNGEDVASAVEHGQQAALGIECMQIVATTHVCATDENLRHRRTARQLGHVPTLLGLEIDTDFFQVRHATCGQQLLGTVLRWQWAK